MGSCSTRTASPRRRTRPRSYGLERLCDVMSTHWAGSAEDVKDAVAHDAREFIGRQTVYDDLALLVVQQR